MSDDQPSGSPNDSTVVEGETTTTEPTSTWPETWRENILGDKESFGDEETYNKEYERLQQKFKSPADIYRSYRDMEKEFSKRAPRIEYDPEMPEDKLKQYREQEGIPDSWKEYDLTFENGLVIGEEDKPEIDGFLEFAHGKNMPNEAVKGAVEWYLQSREQNDQKYQEQAFEHKKKTEDSLKSEWGPEFKANMNAIKELFVDHPEVESKILRALGNDGFALGNNRDVLSWAVDLAKKVNPLATMTLPGGESGIKALDARINELQGMMADREAWFKNPELRKEYEELIAKRDAVNRT